MTTSMLNESINQMQSLMTTTNPLASNIPATIIPCNLVNTIEPKSQCKFVIDNNCLEKDATFDYVHLVYCAIGNDFKFVSIFLLAFLVIVLFLALSSVADEFLCPSLLSVAKNLKMSDSLAGVTLLAFGNGCPDIFASIAAASGDRSELIVGELLGAGIFCTSIVAGLIFIHSDFKLATRPILRDTIFYLFAVYLIWCFCEAREVTFYESLSFILIYVIYLIVALSGQAIHSRLLGNYSIAERQKKCLDGDKSEIDSIDWTQNQEEFVKVKQISIKRQPAAVCQDQTYGSASIKIEQNKNYVTTIQLGSNNNKVCSSIKFQESVCNFGENNFNSDLCSIVKGTKLSSKDNKCYPNDRTSFPTIEGCQLNVKQLNIIQNKAQEINQIMRTKFIESNANLVNMMASKDDVNSPSSLGADFSDLLTQISPLNGATWRSSNPIGKVITILRAPMLFAIILTVPVVDGDKKLSNWCRPLNSIHCITIPAILVCLFSGSFSSSDQLSETGAPFECPPLSLLLSATIVGLLLGLIIFKSTESRVRPKFHTVFAYVGFLMSILWIYTLASEIIGLLKTVGILFSMTDTAIGLGILAWGNSLGDIVANISLAEAGYSRMALGASIGAPLLNLLLGFGLSFTISMKPGEAIEIEHSPTNTLLCSTLAIILLLIMISTLIPPDRSRKKFGYFLISCYGIYFALAICFEYKLINI